MYLLRLATVDDLEALSALALRSKGHWGYDDAFLTACRDELTVTPDRLVRDRIVVVENRAAARGEATGPIGFSAVRLADEAAELVDLFVEPKAIGSGAGRLLWDDAVAAARHGGARHLDIEADPFAAPWYERRGAVHVGTVPSGSIPGRVLPLMRLAL
jgi:GNAT superfamily N-acetyltransferase